MVGSALQLFSGAFPGAGKVKDLAVLLPGHDAEVRIDDSIPVYNRSFCSQAVTRLDSSAEHRRVLRDAFEKAQKLVFIVSPFMTWRAIEADGVDVLAARAVKRGVKVVVVTDMDLNKDFRGQRKQSFVLGKKLMEDAGAYVKVAGPLHNKTLCVDEVMICEGSYNWLSAVRANDNPQKRMERSIMYCGKGVPRMVKDAIREVGGIDGDGGGIKMKGKKALRVTNSGRYFHMTKKYPIMAAICTLISVIVGYVAGTWIFGAFFFALFGLIIGSDYLAWNHAFYKFVKEGKLTEKQVRNIMEEDGGAVGDDTDNDIFWDPDNSGYSGNAWHRD